jgi:hypothetical protein
LWVGETSSAPGNLDGSGALQQVQRYSTSSGTFDLTIPRTNSLSGFSGVFDSVGNKLYVADYTNSQVGIYTIDAPGNPIPVVSNAAVSGTVGTPISTVAVSATNSPTSFDAPQLAGYGLSIDAAGNITGTPTATATNATVAVTATNAAGTSQPATLTLNIASSFASGGPTGPRVTSFNFVPHTLHFEIHFSEPVSGVTMDSFVFTKEDRAQTHGSFDSITQVDPQTYDLNVGYTHGTDADPAAPGALRFDIKTSGSGVVGLSSGLPYTGSGITAAVAPVTPSTEIDPPVVAALSPDTPVGSTVNFVVIFNKGAFNIQPSNVSFETTGTASATLGDIQPAANDNVSTVWNIPVTFSGSGTIAVTLTGATGTISDGNYNYYVGPHTSELFTIPSGSGGTPPSVDNAVVSGSVGTAITPVQVYASNSPTQFDAANLSTYGLAINASGLITGAPTTATPASGATVNVTATNGSGTSTAATITLYIGSGSTPPPSGNPPVVSNATVNGTVNTAITPVTVQATNSPTHFDALGLNAYGLTISNGGVISGVPTSAAAGQTVNVTATNSYGTSNTALITLNIAATPPPAGNPPTITSATTASATVGSAFSYSIVATNSPTSYSADNLAGTGLALNASTGVISGAPNAAGTIVTHLTATNGAGASGAVTLTISVSNATPPPPPPPPPPVPTITSATSASAKVANAFSYQITASASPTSFAADNLTGTGLALNAATGVISGTPSAAGTIVTHVKATNANGTSPAVAVTITVAALQDQNLVFVSPTGAITAGDSIQLGATNASGLPITYTVISGPASVTGTTLLVTGGGTPVTVRASSAGDTNYAAASADVTFTPAKKAQIVTPPQFPVAVHTDAGSLTLSASTDSGLPISYSVVSGNATIDGNKLVFTGSGNITVSATQDGNGTYAPSTVTFTLTANPVPRLVNISSRLRVSAGDADGASIVGFVVAGDKPKQVLIRAVGPSLKAFNISAPLATPSLTLFDSKQTVIGSNAGWSDDAAIAAAGDKVYAFRLGAGSKDAALLITLQPGTYTAQVQSATDSGTALVEVYDVSATDAVPTKQLINISTRGTVGTGDNVLIAGFSVSGNEPKKVLVRGIGPALTGFGVAGAVSDPVITVYSGTKVVGQNDNWETEDASVTGSTAADIRAAGSASGAFPVPAGSADAAVILTLEPGQYSAVVTGANNSSGAAMVEVYEVPDSTK